MGTEMGGGLMNEDLIEVKEKHLNWTRSDCHILRSVLCFSEICNYLTLGKKEEKKEKERIRKNKNKKIKKKKKTKTGGDSKEPTLTAASFTYVTFLRSTVESIVVPYNISYKQYNVFMFLDWMFSTSLV